MCSSFAKFQSVSCFKSAGRAAARDRMCVQRDIIYERNQSINQPTNQPTNQSINQSIDQSISRSDGFRENTISSRVGIKRIKELWNRCPKGQHRWQNGTNRGLNTWTRGSNPPPPQLIPTLISSSSMFVSFLKQIQSRSRPYRQNTVPGCLVQQSSQQTNSSMLLRDTPCINSG